MLSRIRLRSAAAIATFITITSVSTAQAALFTFETDPLAAASPFSSTSSGLTATFTGSTFADPGAFAISYNSTSGPLPLYAGLSGAFLTTSPFSLDPASPLTITFSQPVSTLRLNFALGDRNSSLNFATNTGGTATAAGSVPSGYAYAEGRLTYTGAAFTVATLRAGAVGLAVDNIDVTTTTTVPEPATLTVLGAGLAGLVLRRRRRPHSIPSKRGNPI